MNNHPEGPALGQGVKRSMVQLLAYDGINHPDALIGFAAASCIAVSDIPFNGPMSEVKVARVDGQLILNPTVEEQAIEDAESDANDAYDAVVIAWTDGQTIHEMVFEEGQTERLESVSYGTWLAVVHEELKQPMSWRA